MVNTHSKCEQDTMNASEFLPYALSRYEQEYQRNQNIDSKAFGILGFIGVMVSIFSFLLGGKIPNNQFLGLNILGICVLFVSMGIIIFLILPRKRIKVLDSKRYYEKLIKNQPVADLTKSYVQLTAVLEYRNNKKVKGLRHSMIIMLFGLGFSFLGTILSILVVG